MNSYEERQAARRDRLARQAANAEGEAEGRFDRAHQIVGRIPPGQPILVGHHSEKRHRRDLDRHDANMRKGIEAEKQAQELSRKSEAVGTGGVSSDDPDAIEKLETQLAHAENDQIHMKEMNKLIRKHRDAPDAVQRLATEAQITEKTAGFLLGEDFAGRIGYPDYTLKNNGANIRRLKARIKALKVERATRPEDITTAYNGFDVRINSEINRIQIVFPDKPEVETRATLKRFGFRWAPSQGAWQRQLNNSGIGSAMLVVKALEG